MKFVVALSLMQAMNSSCPPPGQDFFSDTSPDDSLTLPRQLSNSLIIPDFSDRWTRHAVLSAMAVYRVGLWGRHLLLAYAMICDKKHLK